MDASDGQDGRKRKMVGITLLGQHTHRSVSGISVHCYRRGDSYLARGRFERKAFGETIGRSEEEAAVRLRHLLTELDDGSYVPPSQARHLPLVTRTSPRLSLAELAARYLAEKRQLKGEDTMRTYRSRLEPILAFASEAESRRRWPLASDLDRDFAIQCRRYLFAARTTRNGRPGASPTNYSSRQIFNCLETIRGLLNWAMGPTIRLLMPGFANPFTKDIVGERPKKDPLRAEIMPLDVRVQLVKQLDGWQLGALGLAMTLPMRPDELTAILISDVFLERREICFGTRFGGGDFNKGRQSFTLPYPEELQSLIVACIHGRTEGPLLRRRTIWSGTRRAKTSVASTADLERCYERALAAAGEKAMTEQDRKVVFRKLLIDLGGVSPDELANEFKAVAAKLGLRNRFYDLRHGVTTDMHRAEVRKLELDYMTGHTTGDILNEYVALDVHGEMRKYSRHVKLLLTTILDQGRTTQHHSINP